MAVKSIVVAATAAAVSGMWMAAVVVVAVAGSRCFGAAATTTESARDSLETAQKSPDTMAETPTVSVVEWWVETSMTKVSVSATPPNPRSQTVEVAAQQGEMESAQWAVRVDNATLAPTLVGVTLTLAASTNLTAPPPPPLGVSLEAFKVLHVWSNQSTIYGMQGDRWIPDPLVPIDSAYFPPIGAVRLDPGLTHSVWLRFSVGPTAIAGSHQLSVAIQWQAAGSTTSTTITVPVELTVWPAPTTPSRAEYMGAVFAMNTKPHSSIQHGVDLGAYYGMPGVFPPPINQAYVEALGKQRIYADACYLKTPRSIDEYLALLHSGAQYVGLLDVSVAASNGTSLQNYTAQQIDAILALLEPIVGELSARGLLKYAYVYGFDERPQTAEWAGGINQMFGSIKNRFPGLRTMAALRWRGRDAAPTGTATLGSIAGTLDVWVQLYSLWDGADAAQWRAYGGAHETWAYHCISPRPAIGPTGTPGPMRWFNTFLESDALDARLLPWWAAANNVTGWLYYSINLWQSEGRPIPKQQLAPLVPIAGSSVFTSFSTVVYNGAANPHDRGAFSNGDGLLIFPGLDGPLSSIRLENFRDGIEDFALLRRLPDVALQSVVDDAVSFRTGWPIAATQILGINATVSPNGLIALRTRAASLVPHPNRYDDLPVTPQ